MSTKVNGERLGQSAKRSVAVRGQAGRGATVAGRPLPGAAEQKVRIFCLSGFVAGRSASRMAVCRASSSMCATQEMQDPKYPPWSIVRRPFWA
jgi:hypothetical protein